MSPHFGDHDDHEDTDTASQHSISQASVESNRNGFNSVPLSPTIDPLSPSKRESHSSTLNTELSSEIDDISLYAHEMDRRESPDTSAAPSVYGQDDNQALRSPKRFSFSPQGGDSALSSATFNALSPSVYGDSEPSPQPPRGFSLVNSPSSV